MDKASSDRIYELFGRACELEASDRTAFVEQACGEDAELAAEVLALLENEARIPDNFLRSNQLHVTLGVGPTPVVIGRYRILGVLGVGGMGIVYEAEQDNPRRRVALKVLRREVASPETLRRFKQEADLLGRLQHPGIAHIYEAGQWRIGDEEAPFIAMEFVQGAPLHEFALSRALSVQEILELGSQICASIQHAHEHGIVHRDLKPANILVFEDEEGLHCKVLDFGVARLIDPEARAETMATDAHQIVGTVAYMAPEQVASSKDVDTRADVYAVGLILYELLSKRRPFDLSGRPLVDAARIIQDMEPPRLGSIDTRFRGDLETIVAKAIDKNPGERYSASGLAHDIHRYLNDEPISARPPSTWYRLRKFARRNRVLVGGIAAVMGALALGLLLAMAALFQTIRERNAKQEALQVSQAVTHFLTEMIGSADPFTHDPNLTVRDVLDRAALATGTRFAAQPLVEATLRTTIGQAYTALSLYDLSHAELQRAAALWKQIRSRPDVDTLTTDAALGRALFDLRRLDEARGILEATAEEYEALVSADDPQPILALATLAALRAATGDPEAASALLARAEARKAASGMREEDPVAIQLGDVRGGLAVLADDYAAAEVVFREMYHRCRDLYGPRSPQAAHFATGLAMALERTGRSEGALELYEEALETMEDAIGPLHEETIVTTHHYARLLAKAGRTGEALRLLGNKVDELVRAKQEGQAQPIPLYLRGSLGSVQAQAGQLKAAESTLRKALSDGRDTWGSHSPTMQALKIHLADVLLRQKRWTEAAAEAQAVWDSLTNGGKPRPSSIERARIILEAARAKTLPPDEIAE